MGDWILFVMHSLILISQKWLKIRLHKLYIEGQRHKMSFFTSTNSFSTTDEEILTAPKTRRMKIKIRQ